jgi:uncharacterized repeat protein (TIGR01451 family)
MKTFTLSGKQILKTTLLMTTILAAAMISKAQRSYSTPIYSANIQGGQTMFGNSNMAVYTSGSGLTGGVVNTSVMNNTSSTSNEASNMQFVDVDYKSGNAGGVTNASTATLVLPAGTNTIKFARLYWGGKFSTNAFTSAQLRTISIRKGTSGAYTTVTTPATQLDQAAVSVGSGTAYQAYYDVTSFIQTNGAGAYTVANIAASTGKDVNSIGNYAGWSIVVAYENPSLSYYSIRIYDAFYQIKSGSGGSSTITLNNFNAPNNPIAAGDANLSAFVWEGDNYYTGDYLKINGNTYSDAVNPATNMWNGSISLDGAQVATGNPNYKNAMGVDIDQIQVGGASYGINPGATSVQIQFGTNLDEYYASVFAFSIRMQDPNLTIVKTVTGSVYPLNVMIANETLTYVIAGQNTGAGNSMNTVVIDSLPAGVTYLPNSLQVLASPGTGMTGAKSDGADNDNAMYVPASGNRRAYVKFFVGSGATGTNGGMLAQNDLYSVQFQVTTPSDPNQLVTVTNIADIQAEGSILGSITNEASVLIAPTKSLPISLLSFSATKSGDDALLRWSTSSELNNDYMEVQRSVDGVNFTTLSSIKGNGTTTIVHSYEYSDPINNLSGIIYYRLRDVDVNGRGSYSQVIALRLDGTSTSASFSVFPNPFASDIKLNVNSTKEMKGNVVVNNIAGQQVFTQSVQIQNGQNIIVLNNLGGLRPGIYIINFITEEGRIAQKIVKN